MTTMNQLEQKLREARGDQWVDGVKTQALAYQKSLRVETQKSKEGSFYLTAKGTKVRVRQITARKVKVEFPDGSLKEVSMTTFERWIPIHPSNMNQFALKQQLDMQLQVLKDQKRRVNNQPYPIDEKRWILKGLDLAMQALQNVQNPNNQW